MVEHPSDVEITKVKPNGYIMLSDKLKGQNILCQLTTTLCPTGPDFTFIPYQKQTRHVAFIREDTTSFYRLMTTADKSEQKCNPICLNQFPATLATFESILYAPCWFFNSLRAIFFK